MLLFVYLCALKFKNKQKNEKDYCKFFNVHGRCSR